MVVEESFSRNYPFKPPQRLHQPSLGRKQPPGMYKGIILLPLELSLHTRLSVPTRPAAAQGRLTAFFAAVCCELIQTVEGMETGCVNHGRGTATAGVGGPHPLRGQSVESNYRLNLKLTPLLQKKELYF